MTKKAKKIKASSVLPIALTGGAFIGLVLGALMGQALLVTAIGLAVGAGIGYRIDRNNGVSYGRKPH